MSLFGLIGKVVLLPIAVVHDVVTLGGVLNDSEPKTPEVFEQIGDEISD